MARNLLSSETEVIQRVGIEVEECAHHECCGVQEPQRSLQLRKGKPMEPQAGQVEQGV